MTGYRTCPLLLPDSRVAHVSSDLQHTQAPSPWTRGVTPGSETLPVCFFAQARSPRGRDRSFARRAALGRPAGHYYSIPCPQPLRQGEPLLSARG